MQKIQVGIPTGSVFPFAGTVEPFGFLLCDGRSLLRAEYPGLFSVIGTAHGAADATHFNIPDYRGMFLRGVDSGRGLDPNRTTRTAAKTGGNTGDTVGSIQGQATAKNGLTATSADSGHTHSVGVTPSGTGGAGVAAAVGNNTQTNTFGSFTGYSNITTTIGPGDAETRPINANVHFIIKA